MITSDAGNRDEVLDREPAVSPHAASQPALGGCGAQAEDGLLSRAGSAVGNARNEGVRAGLRARAEQEPLPGSALQRILDFGRGALHAREAVLVLTPDGSGQPRCLVSSLGDEEVEWAGEVCRVRGVPAALPAEGLPTRVGHRGRGGPAEGPAAGGRAQAFLGVPVGCGGGLFFSEKDDGGGFTEEDEGLAVFLAEQVAAAVEGARLLAQVSADSRDEVQAQRLSTISRLASVVGHELRNPLSVISNASYFLGTKVTSEDPRVSRHLDIVKQEIRRATRIIENLLDFSRDRAPKPVPVPFRMLLRDALARQEILEEVRVEEHLARDLPLLCVDPAQMRQALSSLLANALEAMPAGGTLRVHAWADDGSVVVRIGDTGCGIPAEDIERILEPLYTTKLHGIGLGLTLVRRVVEAHHGTIRIESEEGKGTAVTLSLPAVGSGATP